MQFPWAIVYNKENLKYLNGNHEIDIYYMHIYVNAKS